MSQTVALKARARGLGGAKGDIAGAAGDVEQRERRLAARRIERVDHQVLPDPVQARRHQIVHQIVALRHAVKHVVHQRLLVAQGDVPEAEMRGLVGPIHQISSPFGRTIARPPQWRYHVSVHKVNVPIMPELPEVETVRRGLQPAMEGSKIVKAEARRKICGFRSKRIFSRGSQGRPSPASAVAPNI